MAESGDLQKLKQCRELLSNVYKNQVNDDIVDNNNITEINNAILSLQNVIRWLESQ